MFLKLDLLLMYIYFYFPWWVEAGNGNDNVRDRLRLCQWIRIILVFTAICRPTRFVCLKKGRCSPGICALDLI